MYEAEYQAIRSQGTASDEKNDDAFTPRTVTVEDVPDPGDNLVGFSEIEPSPTASQSTNISSPKYVVESSNVIRTRPGHLVVSRTNRKNSVVFPKPRLRRLSKRRHSSENLPYTLVTASPSSPRYSEVHRANRPESRGNSYRGDFGSPTALRSPHDIPTTFPAEAEMGMELRPENIAASGPLASEEPGFFNVADSGLPFIPISPQQQIQSPFLHSPIQEPGMPFFPREPSQSFIPNPNPMPSPFPFQAGRPTLPPGPLPWTGYQLVAARLSGEARGPPLTPIYRRFESLNHRLLLFLQDEIAELEEQLAQFDAADTRSRALQGGFLPASHRQGPTQGGEQQLCKEILGSIGYKLSTYNQVLASFKKTQQLPSPMWNEVEEYQAFLAAECPVQEVETRFLDFRNDLVSLSRVREQRRMTRDVPQSPVTRPAENIGFPPSPRPNAHTHQPHQQDVPPHVEFFDHDALQKAVVAMLVAVLVPIMTFAIIPGFVARMTVVMLVATGVLFMLFQSGLSSILTDARGGLDGMIYVCLYGIAMAAIAGAFRGPA